MDNTNESDLGVLAADVQEKLNEALKPHVEKAKAVHEEVIKPKAEEAVNAVRELTRSEKFKRRIARTAAFAEAYGPQLVGTAVTVGLFVVNRRSAGVTTDLLTDIRTAADNTNQTLLDLFDFALRQEERLLLDRRGMGAEIDNYTQKGVPFTYYPGLGVRPNDLSHHERFWGTE